MLSLFMFCCILDASYKMLWFKRIFIQIIHLSVFLRFVIVQCF